MKLFNRFLINFAYFLNTSLRYQEKRQFFYNLLENNDYKYKKYFDLLMMLFILSSIAILIYGVKQDLPDYLIIFNAYVISIVFLIEYILRLWIISSISQVIINQDEYSDLLGRNFDLWFVIKKVTRDKFTYILSIKALIDLIAILPFFHQLRLLRVFILFRVFKLFRYAKSLQTFSAILSSKKFEFFTLSIFASMVIFISSILIYMMEANNPASKIDSLYEAFYWSIVTISTVGYGDVVAVSKEGQFVAVVVILSGISVLAFTTSLFVSAFTEKLDDIKESKTIQDASKLYGLHIICGYENIAKEVAKKLLRANFNVVVLDKSQERIENAKKDGLLALNYDPGSIESYKKLNIDLSSKVKAILCLRENDVDNVYTALTVRSINQDVFIMSLLMNNANRKKLLNSGVNELLYDKEFVGFVAREYIGQPVAFEAIHALRSENGDIQMEEIVVTERIAENISVVGNLQNAKFRIVLLGVNKKSTGKFLFNPIDSILIEPGDFLLVIGNYMFIDEFSKHLLREPKTKGLDNEKN